MSARNSSDMPGDMPRDDRLDRLYRDAAQAEPSPALDRAILAAARLAQGGNVAAADALRDVREKWADALRPYAPDDAALDLVMLVSDGLYFNNALNGGSIPGPVPTGAAMDALVALVERALRT